MEHFFICKWTVHFRCLFSFICFAFPYRFIAPQTLSMFIFVRYTHCKHLSEAPVLKNSQSLFSIIVWMFVLFLSSKASRGPGLEQEIRLLCLHRFPLQVPTSLSLCLNFDETLSAGFQSMNSFLRVASKRWAWLLPRLPGRREGWRLSHLSSAWTSVSPEAQQAVGSVPTHRMESSNVLIQTSRKADHFPV